MFAECQLFFYTYIVRHFMALKKDIFAVKQNEYAKSNNIINTFYISLYHLSSY